MKRIALVLVVVVGGICALAYWNGLRIERGFQENMEQALENGADLPGFDVTQSFERGFFGSTAQATLQSTAGGPALRLEHRIAHGPIPWAGLRHGGKLGRSWIATEVAFDLTTQPALAQVFSELPPIQITTHLRSSGDGVSEFYWAPFETQTPDGGSVAVREMRGEIEFGGANEEAVGSIEWGGVHLETPQFSVKMSPLRGEFAYEDVLKSTVYGQSSFSLESVEAMAGGQSVGDLRDLHWAEQRAVENGKLFLRSQVSLDFLEVMSFRVRELSLESQFENVDLAVWEQARTALGALRRKQHGTRLTTSG